MPYVRDQKVMVQYPKDEQEAAGPRENWTWFPGVVETDCGSGEWEILVTAPELEGDGGDGFTTSPLCFRSADEIRLPEGKSLVIEGDPEQAFEDGPPMEDWLRIAPEDRHPEGGFEPDPETAWFPGGWTDGTGVSYCDYVANADPAKESPEAS